MAQSDCCHAVAVFLGDWASLPDALKAAGLLGGYDCILSAETIYSLDSQQSLLQCIKQVRVTMCAN